MDQDLVIQKSDYIQKPVSQNGNYHILMITTPIIPETTSSFDYGTLRNKPKINGVELDGNMTIEDFGVTSGDVLMIPLSSDEVDELTS